MTSDAAGAQMYDQKRAQQPASQPRGSAERRRPGLEPLVPPDEQDRIVRRLQHASNTFGDTPLKSLEEAESAYDEAVAQLVNALAERRSLLRAGWQDQGRGQGQGQGQTSEVPSGASQADEFRLALRQDREITQRNLLVPPGTAAFRYGYDRCFIGPRLVEWTVHGAAVRTVFHEASSGCAADPSGPDFSQDSPKRSLGELR
ncbi:hypothetical protein [Streptomyces graminilatus]|uniref:hypothetical protein n=1 Tax=Streptomyces graminilatus TaxID=1464070 RepID=UPI0007C6A649